MRRLILILTIGLCCIKMNAQVNPYYDEKLFHFGFSLGINFMDFSTPTADGNDTIGVRQSSLLPGFSVGFITDLRLTRHLNLRFQPTLHFAERRLTYKLADELVDKGHTLPSGSGNYGSIITITSIPIAVPIYLKWSAEREKDYRPYVIGGGGVSFDVMPVSALQSPVVPDWLNYFVEVGFGCDLYFKWFKLCPQLTYSFGFRNQLLDINGAARNVASINANDKFYSEALKGLYTHQITLSFNFE